MSDQERDEIAEDLEEDLELDEDAEQIRGGAIHKRPDSMKES